MSWLFSQALVAESSVESSTDGDAFALLNVMPSPRQFWRNDKTMDVLRRSPFGLTWKPLTADLGEALLTSFRGAFRVPTSHALERAQESTGRKADSGVKWLELLARFDRSTSLWKTPQCSLFEGLDEFSGTWPRWGTMRNGVCYRRATPSGLSAFRAMIDRHLTISGNESGYSQRAPSPIAGDASGSRSSKGKDRPDECGLSGWTRRMRSPTNTDAGRGGAQPEEQRLANGHSVRLSDQLCQRAPTPRSEDSQCAGGHRGNPDTLVAFTRMGTPRTSDAKDSGPIGSKSHATMEGKQYLCAQVKNAAGGQLNPQWEDWFMGWPIGWTDVRHSATVSFRQWLDSHGGC